MSRAASREALRLLVASTSLRTSPGSVALMAVGGVLLLALGAGAAAVFVDWVLRRADARAAARREVSRG